MSYESFAQEMDDLFELQQDLQVLIECATAALGACQERMVDLIEVMANNGWEG